MIVIVMQGQVATCLYHIPVTDFIITVNQTPVTVYRIRIFLPGSLCFGLLTSFFNLQS